ncbi:putative PIN and TRAM-domain containing protein precursor [bacterium BMS3Abin02]|nr:putative PIN and TRAM-domain containing protein precursor [bacterium BMS3Abin02]GBE22998.1 putative PIN and TRAM-domain containing protein precursor [bacterium BMS3Bbin01]HDH26521.1 TRAM domain-containing protein [Actinomycetota bacterium]HDL50250.1 TRAM domain-containing protein [Actinomycetota bacterium]
MIVEIVRLLITLALTAVGYRTGQAINAPDPETAQVLGAILGAGTGYVLGGVLGRRFRTTLEEMPNVVVPRSSGAELFAGAFGLVVGMFVGLVVGLPLILFLPPEIGLPLAVLVVLIFSVAGARLFSGRADEILAATGLRRRGGLVTRSLDASGYLLDSSAAIDGRVLNLARLGLLPGRLWIPGFVIDELQGLADAKDRDRRRRGRRGLDVLEALRDVHGSDVAVLEETVPEFEDVDAKLIVIAGRAEASLVTTDHNLAKAAAARGISVLNPQALAEALKVPVATGDRLLVSVSRVGSEPGQGVAFLDDGTMVVVEDAAEMVGSEMEVEIIAVTRTAVGRMLFGRQVS